MGWAGGGALLSSILFDYVKVHGHQPSVDLCVAWVDSFEQLDMDVHNEVWSDKWPNLEEACYVLHPSWRDDADEEEIERAEEVLELKKQASRIGYSIVKNGDTE